MDELKKEENLARPVLGRVFLRQLNSGLPDLTAHFVFWSLLLVGLTADLASKHAVFAKLQYGDTVPIIDGIVQLVRTQNPGAAFGIAAGKRGMLLAVSVIAIIVIFLVFFFSGTKRRSIHVALGLFAAGVCGNFYDRLFNNGLVRDFIDIVYWPGKHWPAFNIADSMLCIAVGLMIIATYSTPNQKPCQKHGQQQK